MFGLLIVYCSKEFLPPPWTRVTTVSKSYLFLVTHLEWRGVGWRVDLSFWSAAGVVCVHSGVSRGGGGSWEIWLLGRSLTLRHPVSHERLRLYSFLKGQYTDFQCPRERKPSNDVVRGSGRALRRKLLLSNLSMSLEWTYFNWKPALQTKMRGSF